MIFNKKNILLDNISLHRHLIFLTSYKCNQSCIYEEEKSIEYKKIKPSIISFTYTFTSPYTMMIMVFNTNITIQTMILSFFLS